MIKDNEEFLTVEQFSERIVGHKAVNKVIKLLMDEADDDFTKIKDHQKQMFLDHFNARMYDSKLVIAPKYTIIDELRLHQGSGYSTSDGVFEDIYDSILDAYKPEGYEVEIVNSEFEDYGRWSNYETDVYKVTVGDNSAYFELGREVPATEMQEGMDYSWHLAEVYPKEVTKIIFVHELDEG